MAATVVAADEPLAGTKPLTAQGDLASQMVAGIDTFLLRETEDAIAKRAALWKRDLSSQARYDESVAPNRARLATTSAVCLPLGH